MNTAQTALRWTVQAYVPQLALRRAALHGQLGAKLAVDRSTWDNPFPIYDQIREHGPLLRTGRLAVTASHEIAGEVLRSPAYGVAVATSEQLPPLVRRVLAALTDPWTIGPTQAPSLLAIDPPDHTRLRRLVAKVFTARAMAALESRIGEIADELLSALDGESEVDLIEAYAAPLPVRVIAEILGVPQSMHQQLLLWGNAVVMILDPSIGFGQFRVATRALNEMHVWLSEHLGRLRRNPGDNLLSHLAAVADDEPGADRKLNDLELRATALLVIGAGFETTVNLLANGTVQLLSHPDQLNRLQDEPDLWANAVDEVLRIDSPIQETLRFTRQEVLLAGEQLPAGCFVGLLLGGANWDPDVFPDPARFNVDRPNSKEHLAFSAGVHFCLGASLARLEGSVGLRKLVERYPDVSLAPGALRRQLRVLRGYERLPVLLAGPQSAPRSRSSTSGGFRDEA